MHTERGACEHGLDGHRPRAAQRARPAVNRRTTREHPFTSHEHDGDLALINMNGRIYDLALGQFLTPDPILQEPYGQGLNRYAYVKNSPLNYVDPSGFEFEEDLENGLAAGVVAAGHVTAAALVACGFGACAGTAVVGGGAAAAIGGGAAAGGGVVTAGGVAIGLTAEAVGGMSGLTVGAFSILNREFNLLGNYPEPTTTTDTARLSKSSVAPGAGASPSAGKVMNNPVAPVTETRTLERLDRQGEYSELPTEGDGNALATRGRRPPRGAPMPGPGSAPVLRPMPQPPRVPLPSPMQRITDALRPGGRLIGDPGSSPAIRIIRDLNPLTRAEEMFWHLTQNGTVGQVLEAPNYPGLVVRLPGGGVIGIRPMSTSGPPTIDVRIQGVGIREIKFLGLVP